MSIFEILKHNISYEDLIIGIGLGEKKNQNIRIITTALNFSLKNSVWIYLFGEKNAIGEIKSYQLNNSPHQSKIKLISSIEPEKEMITYLINNKINSIVRGSFKSSKFLKLLKDSLKVKNIYRLALLETANGEQFFYGPVGIDECNTFKNKQIFIEKSLKIFRYFEIKPKISILSGGRIGDLGRNKLIDKTIDDAENLVKYFNSQEPNIEIFHDHILIENSIKNGANLILAPNGISGNLIYRTLIHLGNGKSYGAFYLDTKYSIIDTSRVAPENELNGAFFLASSISAVEK